MKLSLLSDLFAVTYGNKLDLCRMPEPTGVGDVQFIGRTGGNNGVTATVGRLTDVEPYPGGCVTVALGGAVLASFLQTQPFYTAQNVAVLRPLVPMSQHQLLFYCTAIQANRFRYNAFGREANRTLRFLRLPAIDDLPAYVLNRPRTELDALAETGLPPLSSVRIDTANWRPFKYTDLFTIVRGQGPSLADAREAPGPTPYVTASEKNNGVATWTASEPKHPARCLTVATNGSVGECFFQPDAFSASSDVAVLQSKTPLSAEALLFIAALVRREGKFKYGYGRKWGLQRIAASSIRLPETASGKVALSEIERLVRQLPTWHLLAGL